MPRLNVYEAAEVAKAKAADAVARANRQKRKDEDRRKILLGAFLMEVFKRQPELRDVLRGDLDKFLIHDRDKELMREWLSTVSEPAR